VTSPRWRPRLGRAAERDLVEILKWTRDRFGPEQAWRYREIILWAVRALADGPEILGSRDAPGVHGRAKILHAARGGRKARHFLLYKVAGADRIVIGRILHDAMDIERHVPSADDWE
jgi:toxin ParE1/3/4